MINPCKKIEGWHVKYHEMNDYVAQCLEIDPKKMETIFGEANNDSSHEYEVTRTSLTTYDLAQLDEFRNSGYIECWRAGIVLDHLCINGFLEPGVYNVSVSW